MCTGLFVQGVGDPNVIFSLWIGSSDFHQLLSTGIATSQVIPEVKKNPQCFFAVEDRVGDSC